LALAARGVTAQAADVASVPVSWAFEAPDMADVSSFNESGSAQVPIVYEPSQCHATVDVVEIHEYQYIAGSTRGGGHMPSCISAGTVVSIAKQSQELSALHITVRLEAGESDWTSSQAFTIPIMSATQWEQLGPTTAWVFSGYLDVLPHYMNRVIVSCK